MNRYLNSIIISIFLIPNMAFSDGFEKSDNMKFNEAVGNILMYGFAKQYEKALEACEQAYQYDKATGSSYYADIYRLKGEYKKSIEWAEKAIQLFEKEKLPTITPLLIMASSYALEGDDEKSNEVVNKVIHLYPENPLGYKFYAEYYEKENNKEKAIEYWNKAYERFTDSEAKRQAKKKIEDLGDR